MCCSVGKKAPNWFLFQDLLRASSLLSASRRQLQLTWPMDAATQAKAFASAVVRFARQQHCRRRSCRLFPSERKLASATGERRACVTAASERASEKLFVCVCVCARASLTGASTIAATIATTTTATKLETCDASASEQLLKRRLCAPSPPSAQRRTSAS